MQHAFRMGGREPVEQSGDRGPHLHERSRPGASYEVGERTVLHQLHRVPRHAFARIPVVDRNDARVRELRGHARFAPKVADGLRVVGHACVENLEGDLTLESEVAHAPHVAVGTASELGEKLVVVAHSLEQTRVDIAARPDRFVVSAHEQRARCAASVRAGALEVAQHRRDRRISARRVLRERTRENRRERLGHLRSQQRERRQVVRGRILADQRREAHGGELPLVASLRRVPLVVPLGRREHPAAVGAEPGRDDAARDGPLPAQHPRLAERRVPDAVRRERAVHVTEIVQVRHHRPELAEEADGRADVILPLAIESRAQRLAIDPVAKVPRSALHLGEGVPDVVRGRNDRVVQVSEMARFGQEPGVMRRVRRCDQRERSVEGIDDFHREAGGADHHALRTPPPSLWELPVGQMRRHPERCAVGAYPRVVRERRRLAGAIGSHGCPRKSHG